MRAFILWVALTAGAVVLGFGLAWLALFALSAILPPFRREDGDTLREFIPAAIAYTTWGLPSAVGGVLAWRWVHHRSSQSGWRVRLRHYLQMRPRDIRRR